MIATAGIDTWSPCWYVDRGSMAGELLGELARVPVARGALLAQPVAGHRVGWNASAGLLYAEGHPGGPDVLCGPDELPGALQRLAEALLAAGVPVPPGIAHAGSDIALTDDLDGFGGVRRCDATVDLQLSSRGEGLAVLAGVAAMATTVPRGQADVRYAKDGSGSVETVYLRGLGGAKVLGRWYDKGLESIGPGQRGLRIRVEDQRRYPKGHRRDVAELTSSYVRAKFQERFLPMWRATKGVTVAGRVVLVEKIVELVEEEELSVQRAEQLAGYLALRRGGVRHSRSTEMRRKRLLREHGLVEADGAIEEVEVDLHSVLEQALDGAAWGGQG
jgi:hypothetical protein